MRHHHGHFAVGLQRRDHVLHKHQVRLLAAFGHEVTEPFFELHRLQTVVLRERRIRDDSVKSPQFAVGIQMQRFFQSIPVLDVGTANAMQQHVHFADRPGASVEFLPGQFQIARISAGFLNMFLRPNQHTARAHRRVQDAHAFLRINQQHQQFNDLGRRIELAPLFARTVGEVLDQVFVSGPQQVRNSKSSLASRMSEKCWMKLTSVLSSSVL